MDMDPDCKDLIDQLIQLDPLDRLGCPMTGHDMKRLMRHPFFVGINFKTNLQKTTNVRQLLADTEMEEVSKQMTQLQINTNP